METVTFFREILGHYVMLLVSFMKMNHHHVKRSDNSASDLLDGESFIGVEWLIKMELFCPLPGFLCFLAFLAGTFCCSFVVIALQYHFFALV